LAAPGVAIGAVECGLASGRAFGATRPPGHHALASRAMGFCFVNNAVVAARHAQQLGAARVLIVDWDVHHGNGTQALIERDPTIRYVSLHQYPWYPGTGAEHERGVGNVFNVPRPPGLERGRYLRDLLAAVDAALTGWRPDLLLISAGFDSLAGGPLGGFTLEPEDVTQGTRALRERVAPAPVVRLLRGGYRLHLVAAGAVATVQAPACARRPIQPGTRGEQPRAAEPRIRSHAGRPIRGVPRPRWKATRRAPVEAVGAQRKGCPAVVVHDRHR